MNLEQDYLFVKFFTHVVSDFLQHFVKFQRICTRSVAIPTIRFERSILTGDLGSGRLSEFRFKFNKS
jgi:hypothetical protein